MPTPEEQAKADAAAKAAKADEEAKAKTRQSEADKAKTAEQSRRDHQASVGGAQAVAEAVKRVADAAVAEAQKAPALGPEGDFVVSGSPGGRFTIRGNGFTGSGTVFLNGQQLFTDEWGGFLIRGKLPADAKSGEVVVRIDENTEKRGYLKL